MITLCMDTSHTYLVLALIRDDQVIARVQEECWKKQSEEIFPQLIGMMKKVQLEPEDIDQIVISEGPGSYTGVRIAMTVAKVVSALRKLPLYTIGTLQLYAGREDCRVLLDARGKRAYTCRFRDGEALEEEQVLPLEEIRPLAENEQIVGDGHLIGREDVWPDIAENFLALKDAWKKAENVHLVVPDYLKPSEAYLLHK